jgi:phosphopantothenoylcysteine synthetase/decarboxylase
VTLATSHPDLVPAAEVAGRLGERWSLRPYQTFAELESLMRECLTQDLVDALIHCAAVSDYQSAGIYGLSPRTTFDPKTARWRSGAGSPRLVDRAAAKVKSSEPELWLRLVRTPKLIDLVRRDWGFQGILVKFKLEAGVSEEALLEVAESSRRQSHADLMVANTLEGMKEWARMGPIEGKYSRVNRQQLASRLLAAVEELHQERVHG